MVDVPKRRGRPKGSKNKSKEVAPLKITKEKKAPIEVKDKPQNVVNKYIVGFNVVNHPTYPYQFTINGEGIQVGVKVRKWTVNVIQIMEQMLTDPVFLETWYNDPSECARKRIAVEVKKYLEGHKQ